MSWETVDAVYQALKENDAQPYGRGRTAVAEQLVDAADALEDTGVLVTALTELVEAYEFGGEGHRSPVPFARLLQLWDAEPGQFSEWERYQLYWRFKWVVTSMLDMPDVPLAAVERVIADMENRYRGAELGLQPVLAMRFHLSRRSGVGTDQAYVRWTAEPRTTMSDCEACEARVRGSYLVELGNDARGLDEWQRVLSGELSCAEEPAATRSHALMPLLRQGRLDEARSHHLSGYREARGKPSHAAEIGRHLEFCAASGNEARGLEILAAHRQHFTADLESDSRMTFLTGVEALTRRLVDGGRGDLPVPGPQGTRWTAATLLATAARDATGIADRFDRRNGNTLVGDRRRSRVTAAALDPVRPVELGLRVRAPQVAAPPPTAPRTAAVDIEDFDALVAEARRLRDTSDARQYPVWRRIAERAATRDIDDELRGDLATASARDAFEHRDITAALASFDEAVAHYARAGRPGPLITARARRLWADVLPGAAQTLRWDELTALTVEAVDLLASGTIEPREYVNVLVSRALAAHQQALHEDQAAEEQADAATSDTATPDEECPAPAPSGADTPPSTAERFETAAHHALEVALCHDRPRSAGVMHHVLADRLARVGDTDRALEHLHAALEQFAAAEAPWETPQPLLLLGNVHANRGEFEEAAARIQEALAVQAQWPEERFPQGFARQMLAQVQVQLDDLDGAVRSLTEAAPRFDDEGERDQATATRAELAGLLARMGRFGDAAALLESVVEDGQGGLPNGMWAQVRLDLARVLQRTDEPAAAAEELLSLADWVSDWPDQGAHALVATEAAVTLARCGRWDAAETAYQRALDCLRAAPHPPLATQMMREFARELMSQRQDPDGARALAWLDEAQRLIAATPDSPEFPHWLELSATHHRRGCVLADLGRLDDALAELETAIDVCGPDDPDRARSRAESVYTAALVERDLGRTDAAHDRVAAAITWCEQIGATDTADALRPLHDSLATATEAP